MTRRRLVTILAQERPGPDFLRLSREPLAIVAIGVILAARVVLLDRPAMASSVSAFCPAVAAASIVSAMQLAVAFAGRGRGLPALLRPVPLRCVLFAVFAGVACPGLALDPLDFGSAALIFLAWQGLDVRAVSIAVVLGYLGHRLSLFHEALEACAPAGLILLEVLIALGIVFAVGYYDLRDRLARMGVTPVDPLELALLPVALTSLWIASEDLLARGWDPGPDDPIALTLSASLALTTIAGLVYLGRLRRRVPVDFAPALRR